MGQMSAVGQPTWPTQPSIPQGSVNEMANANQPPLPSSTVVKALLVLASLVKRRYTKYLGFTFTLPLDQPDSIAIENTIFSKNSKLNVICKQSKFHSRCSI